MIMVVGRKWKGEKRTVTKRSNKKSSTSLTTTRGDIRYLEPYPELRSVVDKLRELKAKISNRQRMNLIDSMEAGDLLIEAKKTVNYGDWTSWLEEGPGVGIRQSQFWMELARHRDLIQKYLLDPRNESDSFLTTPEPTTAEAHRIITFKKRETKKSRSDRTYIDIMDDIRRAAAKKTPQEHLDDVHRETEEEFEESLERDRVEIDKLREVWESVSPATIRNFLDNLVNEGLWPYGANQSKTRYPPSVVDEEEYSRGVKEKRRKKKVQKEARKKPAKKGSGKGKPKPKQ